MIKFDFAGKSYLGKFWLPEDGNIGSLVALDTETTKIVSNEIPDYVIGQAYAGGDTVYFIRLETLDSFVRVVEKNKLVLHNAPFDIAVIEKESGFDFDALIREQRLFDTGLLYRLVRLAHTGEVPPRWSLQHVAKEILGMDLPKEEELRCNFGRYRNGNSIDYDDITEAELKYAACDVIATYEIYQQLKKQVESFGTGRLNLSHKIQLMGAYALDKVLRTGVGFDLDKKNEVLARLQASAEEAKRTLAKYGFIPGKKGVQQDYQDIIQKLGLNLPLTRTGKVSSGADHLEQHRGHEFIDALLSFKELEKQKSFLVKVEQDRLYPSYNAMVSTGRTSCSNPNVQQIPREGGLRECFIPSPGHCFIIIDYSTLELCTLAQVCLDRYGSSKMAELINRDVDLHRWFAAIVANKSESEITDSERQYAKACNFGFPGGLGTARFLEYARNTFGITDMNEEKASALKEKWLSAFPEMRHYLQDSLLDRHDFSSLEWCEDPKMAASIFKRIISGNRTTTTGKPYKPETIRWAFEEVLPDVAPWVGGVTEGSRQLLNEVAKETVSTRTGRIRGKIDYCQARNTPFQGLAADGAKIALYRLVRAGFRVVLFVHDEFVIEVPVNSDLDYKGEGIERIVVEAMESVVPDINIRADWFVADRWYKKGKKIFDGDGKTTVFSATSSSTGMEQWL